MLYPDPTPPLLGRQPPLIDASYSSEKLGKFLFAQNLHEIECDCEMNLRYPRSPPPKKYCIVSRDFIRSWCSPRKTRG